MTASGPRYSARKSGGHDPRSDRTSCRNHPQAPGGAAHAGIAEDPGVSVPTVLLWRRRFKQAGPRRTRRFTHPRRSRVATR
jgi:hypothetical protein